MSRNRKRLDTKRSRSKRRPRDYLPTRSNSSTTDFCIDERSRYQPQKLRQQKKQYPQTSEPNYLFRLDHHQQSSKLPSEFIDSNGDDDGGIESETIRLELIEEDQVFLRHQTATTESLQGLSYQNMYDIRKW